MDSAGPQTIANLDRNVTHMGISIVMGVPQVMNALCPGRYDLDMDDNWGCAYFRKPPF